jgi:hypothetical protein
MTTYSIAAPDGQTYRIEGPAGASQEQVQAEVLKQHPNAGNPPQKSASSGQFAENEGGAAFGRPINRGTLNVQATPRPLESALAGLTKEAVVNPVLGATQLATGGNIGGQAAQNMAQQAKVYEQANPMSYLGGQIAGVVAPASGISKGIGMIPSMAKAAPLAQTVLGSVAQGALMPNETGKTGAEFYKEKAYEAPLNAALGAAPTVAVKGGQLLGSLLRKSAGISTGAGEEAFKQAYKAGKEANPEFIANMRGEAPMEDVLNAAKSNLSSIRNAKNETYRSGMVDISKDKSVLNFNDIDSKLKEATNIGAYKGVTTNPNAIKALQDIKQSVNEWKGLDPAEYHTPEGMDALKQRIGAILEDIPYGTKARHIADDIYHSVKSTISEQAPIYNNVMKDYSESSDLIKEIEKSLSLGQKASVATGLNKLQSLMRNNVNTNYGYRQELANELMKQGGQDLMPALAGQALNSWTPRGLVGQGLDAGAALSILGGVTHLPATVATMATTSPRLMGETAYKLGQVASKIPSNKMTDEQKKLAQLLMIRAAQGANNE